MGGNGQYTRSPKATTVTLSATTYEGDWWQLQLPAPRVINGFRILSQGIQQYAIVGSITGGDGSWMMLDARTTPNVLVITSGVATTIMFSNTTAYTYYRLVIIQAHGPTLNGDGSFAVWEMRFLEAPPNNRALRVGTASGGDGLVVDWNGDVGITGTYLGISPPDANVMIAAAVAFEPVPTAYRMGTLCLAGRGTDQAGRLAFLNAIQGTGTAGETDLQIRLRNSVGGVSSTDTTVQALFQAHNGNLKLRGSIVNNGFDYAEMFEWEDGNAGDEDRRGMTVVLASEGRIRLATDSDAASDIFGAVSVTYCVLGNNTWDAWQGKFLRDDFGSVVKEDVTLVSWADEAGKEVSYRSDAVPPDIVIPESARYIPAKVDKLNPDWDSNVQYVPREERKEWAAIGFLGKLRIRNTAPKNPSWIKLRDVSTTVAEYLIK
jgi:hypothetical protein